MIRIKSFNDKEKFYLRILVFAGIWILVFGYLIYFGYISRANTAFKYVKEKMELSTVLSSKIGNIEKVTYHNFPTWASFIDNDRCVKYKVKTSDNKSHNVCAILYLQRIDAYSTVGYYVDGEKILDFPRFDINEYKEEILKYKYNGEKIEFSGYYELFLKLRKLDLFENQDKINNIYELSYDDENKIWKCRIKTYNDSTPDSKIIKSHILLINDSGEILAFWEDNNLDENVI